MDANSFEKKYVRPIFGGLTAYETFALFSGRVPTLSAMIWWLYKRWWGQALLWAIWGWLTSHFFVRTVGEGLAKQQERHKMELMAIIKKAYPRAKSSPQLKTVK